MTELTHITHDLGADWYLNLWSDGTATIRNAEKGQRINLSADSLATLKRIFSDLENERLTPPAA